MRTRLDLIELEGHQLVLADFSGPRPAAAIVAGTERDGHLGARWGLQGAPRGAPKNRPGQATWMAPSQRTLSHADTPSLNSDVE